MLGHAPEPNDVAAPPLGRGTQAGNSHGRRALRFGLVALGLLLLVVLAVVAAGDPRPRIAPALLARVGARTAPVGDEVRVTWTGVSGVAIEFGQPDGEVQTILVDPFVTRHSFFELAGRVDSDVRTAEAAFPRATAILVGHGHHDHLADAPRIAARTGATIIANESSCHLAWTMGIANPSECQVHAAPSTVATSRAMVELIPAPHGQSALGVPFPGTSFPTGDRLPYLWEMKEGGPLAFVIRANGIVLYHQGSAGLDDALLERVRGLKPDLAIIGLALRQNTPQFEERLFAALQPKRVAAVHYDDFFGRTFDDPVTPMRGVDLPAFERKVAEVVGPQALVTLRPFEPYVVPAR